MLQEGLAKKIAEDSAACGKILLQLDITEISDFDRSLFHFDQVHRVCKTIQPEVNGSPRLFCLSLQALNSTLQHSMKVSARLRELQLAIAEAQPLWKVNIWNLTNGDDVA